MRLIPFDLRERLFSLALMLSRVLLLFRVLLLSSLLVVSAQAQAECIVLLHGLLRSDSSFTKMSQHLEKQGYTVINQDYPSTQTNIETLAPGTINSALGQCDQQEAISFVTHSMGGILVRYYLKHFDIPTLKTVVMLAPPNAGSEIVDKLSSLPPFEWLNGPAGSQLGTDDTSMPIVLGAVDYNLGVIAGSDSINPILSMLIPGDDDGKVAVERTKVKGMRDHIVLPVSHPFIMKDKEAINQTIFFLKNGKFSASKETPKTNSMKIQSSAQDKNVSVFKSSPFS